MCKRGATPAPGTASRLRMGLGRRRELGSTDLTRHSPPTGIELRFFREPDDQPLGEVSPWRPTHYKRLYWCVQFHRKSAGGRTGGPDLGSGKASSLSSACDGDSAGR